MARPARSKLAAVNRRLPAPDFAHDRLCRPRSFPGIAWRALLASRKPLHADALPPLAVSLPGVRVDAARVASYREVCGATADGPVPPAFAHVLAGSAQLTLLTHRVFPLRVLGTVHVRNRSRQTRSLVPGEVVEVGVRTGELRETPRGAEHEVVTEVRGAEGEVVWAGLSTLLVVDRQLPRAQTGARPGPALEHVEPIAVPADIGRRYGRVSGDLNPIHLHPILARLFGLKRAIAHGMWTLARALAALESRLWWRAMTVEVSFRRPLFIPAAAELHWSDGGDEIRFAVTSAGGTFTHAEGTVGRAQE